MTLTIGPSLDALVEAAREDLVELCTLLVAAPSFNPPGDTRAVARVVEQYLRARKCQVDTVTRETTMPNLVAAWGGAGSGPHLVLNVHLDTMPQQNPAAWTVPPFQLTRRGGRLFGLGMGNMKGAVAAMSLAFAVLGDLRDDWRGRISFTAVADECVFGDNGSEHLLAVRSELAGDALLNGEGAGGMRLGVAEKGLAWFRLDARGEGGHAVQAIPGKSPLSRLARVLLALEELGGRPTKVPPALRQIDSADPGLLLSASASTLHAGSLISQIPNSASADVDFRLPPGTSLALVEELVAERCTAEDVSWQLLKGWEAHWTLDSDRLVRAVASAANEVRRQPPAMAVRLPASDATRWRRLGVPAVCYGPQPTLVAGIDDYVEEQDVVDSAKVYVRAALTFLDTAAG